MAWRALLLAGLGTVANSFGFIAGFSPTIPEHRRWLRAHPGKMPKASSRRCCAASR